ncbi:hypothetical protein EDC96DRAFT_562448 [Choanephora cucurbitarum]|nr:hypothetical protein EDC96DRAFT_562448 [Choanephora cucurbitarum]
MTRQYASSVCSRKSATSAKSGRSFLSLSIPIQLSKNDKDTSSVTSTVSSSIMPQFIRKWTSSNKKKNDSDSMTTRSSTSSINKLKQFIFLGKKSTPPTTDDSNTSSLRLSLEEGVSSSSSSITNTSSFVRNSYQPTGILANRGEDSAEAIEERQRRRHQRRENILRLQRQKAQRFIPDTKDSIESSSEDTLLTDDGLPTNSVQFLKSSDSSNDAWENYNPRIMFIDSSPVPRFRNVAPPPPSPSYLSILIDSPSKDSDLHSIIKSPASDESEPIVYASQELLQPKDKSAVMNDEDWESTPFSDIHDQRMSQLVEMLRPKPPSKLRLDFFPPFIRGQTLKFSLQNTIPEDHIILFKFLTSQVLAKWVQLIKLIYFCFSIIYLLKFLQPKKLATY